MEIWLQNQKFEILFETGAVALIQGYYTESVAAIHAAMERFYEFCARVMLHKHGVDFKDVDETWKKTVKGRSERQLGAYVFLYLLETRTAQKLDEKLNSFRNEVLHNGYMPSYDEAFNFAEKVYYHISTVLKDVRERAGEAFRQVIVRTQNPANAEMGMSSLCIPTTISHADGDLGKKAFAEALDELRNDRMHRHYEV